MFKSSWLSFIVATRRKFLYDCSALMAAALTSPAVVLAGSTASIRKQRSLHEIPFSALAGQLNTPFCVRAASGKTIQVTLAEAKMRPENPLQPGRRPPWDAGNEKFSLIFSGCRRDLLEQNTYAFEHRKLGGFELFIVPVFTRNRDRIDYQAVVNRPQNHAFQTRS
jgi:hypothetical protein